MIDPGPTKTTGGFDASNVAVMLGMLECIHEKTTDDEVMADVANTVGRAIRQLRELQRLAYLTMIEIEAERATGRASLRLIHRKPQ